MAKINEHDALKALIEGDLVKYRELMEKKFASTRKDIEYWKSKA